MKTPNKEMLKKEFVGEIKDVNNEERTLTALISTGAVDRMGEVIDPKGIDLRNFRKNPIVAWAHDYTALPIGKALWTRKDPRGIISKVQFATHQFADEVFNLYKEKFLNAFSVGFIPTEWVDGDGKKTPARTYTKWELLEYSAVPVPANAEALQLAIQKGVVHDDKIIDDIQRSMDEEEPVEEEKPAEEPKEEPKEDEKAFDDLIAENKLLAEEVNGLNNDNTALRFKLYEALTVNHNNLLEIADNVTLDKVQGLINGAIRKVTGKVD
jgi:HK97 family phage prohead protease